MVCVGISATTIESILRNDNLQSFVGKKNQTQLFQNSPYGDFWATQRNKTTEYNRNQDISIFVCVYKLNMIWSHCFCVVNLTVV